MSLHTTGGQYKYNQHQESHSKVWLPSYWAIHNLLLLLTRLLMYRLYRTLLDLRDFYHLVLLRRPAKSLLFPHPQLLAYQRQSVRKGWIPLVVPCLLVDRFPVEVCRFARAYRCRPVADATRGCYFSASLCLIKRSISVFSCLRRPAISSVMATERCLPPVQPTPMVK